MTEHMFIKLNDGIPSEALITPFFQGERGFITVNKNEREENARGVRRIAKNYDNDIFQCSQNSDDDEAFVGSEMLFETFQQLIMFNNECINSSCYNETWTHPSIAYLSELIEYMFSKCNKLVTASEVPEVRYLAVEIFNRAMKVKYDRLKGEDQLFAFGRISTTSTISTMLHCINISAKFLLGEMFYRMSDIVKIVKDDFNLETDPDSMRALEKQILMDIDFKIHRPTLYNFVMTMVALLVEIKPKTTKNRFRLFMIIMLDFVYLHHRQIFLRFYEVNDLNYSETLGLRHLESDKALLSASIVFMGIIVSNGNNAKQFGVFNVLSQLSSLTRLDEELIASLASVILELLLI